jgi:hypothetical protein
MKHLKGYLESIGFFLPQAQKDDILKELSENILSKVEDREAELGRPLNEAEQDAILKSYGSPLVVASRYVPETGGLTFGKQLISPALFPLYLRILLLGLGIALTIQVVLNLTLHLPADTAFSRFLFHAFVQSAAVTFIFVLLQYHLNQNPTQWDVLLNPNALAKPDTKKAPRISRAESIAQIIISLIFISALQGLLAEPLRMFSPFAPAAIWYQLYIPFLLFQVVGLAQATVCLFRPHWVRFYNTIQIGIELGSLVILGILLTVGQWVILLDPTNVPTKLFDVLNFINQYFFYGILCAIVIGVVQLAWRFWNLGKVNENQVTPNQK